LKIYNLGFRDYQSLIQAETNAKALIKKASEVFLQGDFLKANQLYEEAMDVFEFVENKRLVAETSFRISLLQKETQILNKDSHILKRFPKSPFEDPIIKAFHHMIKALLAEIEKNWGAAEKEWRTALNIEPLTEEYKIICQGALVKSEFKNWLSNPTPLIKKSLIENLNKWQDGCENHNHYVGLCQVYLLRARIDLALFKFDQIELWLDRCLRISLQEDMKFYYDAALKEKKRLEELRKKIGSIIKRETYLTHEEQEKRVQEYVREALGIKKSQEDSE
jgi:hypothetical protein